MLYACLQSILDCDSNCAKEAGTQPVQLPRSFVHRPKPGLQGLPQWGWQGVGHLPWEPPGGGCL